MLAADAGDAAAGGPAPVRLETPGAGLPARVGLTDQEFEREILQALDQSSTKISLRLPNELLDRTKRAALRRGVPYQSLIKAIIDNGVRRLERQPAGEKRPRTPR